MTTAIEQAARFDPTTHQHVLYIMINSSPTNCVEESEWRVNDSVVHCYGWEFAETIIEGKMPTPWWRYLRPQCGATQASTQCGVCP